MIQQLITELSILLKKNNLKLATAESCTGGGLSFWLTSLPGSSEWFECGWITYSNHSKQNLLNVSAETLAKFGAVSEQTAQEMAIGALQNSKADISISITGIAGPDGGSKEKPVGTVWMGYARKNQEAIAKKYLFSGDRKKTRDDAMIEALKILLGFINKK